MSRFANGDILLPKITPTFEAGRVFPVAMETPVGAGTTELHVLRAVGDNDARFLAYVARSEPFLQAGAASLQGVGNLRRVTTDWVRSFPVEEIDSATQSAIADYLDRETAQIDTLIAKQEQLIATLRERQQSTRGELFFMRVGAGNRLKWWLHERDTRAGDLADSLPLLAVSISWGVRRRDEVTGDPAQADDLRHYKIARHGDIVINRMRAFQGALGVAPMDGIVSPDYAVIRCDARIDSDWLARLMKTPRFVSEMTQRLKGIGGVDSGVVRTPRINVNDLLDISVDIPPTPEQSLESSLDAHTTAMTDRLVAKAEQFIALARERRSALITAAVTGQIDVSIAA